MPDGTRFPDPFKKSLPDPDALLKSAAAEERKALDAILREIDRFFSDEYSKLKSFYRLTRLDVRRWHRNYTKLSDDIRNRVATIDGSADYDVDQALSFRRSLNDRMTHWVEKMPDETDVDVGRFNKAAADLRINVKNHVHFSYDIFLRDAEYYTRAIEQDTAEKIINRINWLRDENNIPGKHRTAFYGRYKTNLEKWPYAFNRRGLETDPSTPPDYDINRGINLLSEFLRDREPISEQLNEVLSIPPRNEAEKKYHETAAFFLGKNNRLLKLADGARAKLTTLHQNFAKELLTDDDLLHSPTIYERRAVSAADRALMADMYDAFKAYQDQEKNMPEISDEHLQGLGDIDRTILPELVRRDQEIRSQGDKYDIAKEHDYYRDTLKKFESAIEDIQKTKEHAEDSLAKNPTDRNARLQIDELESEEIFVRSLHDMIGNRLDGMAVAQDAVQAAAAKKGRRRDRRRKLQNMFHAAVKETCSLHTALSFGVGFAVKAGVVALTASTLGAFGAAVAAGSISSVLAKQVRVIAAEKRFRRLTAKEFFMAAGFGMLGGAAGAGLHSLLQTAGIIPSHVPSAPSSQPASPSATAPVPPAQPVPPAMPAPNPANVTPSPAPSPADVTPPPVVTPGSDALTQTQNAIKNLDSSRLAHMSGKLHGLYDKAVAAGASAKAVMEFAKEYSFWEINGAGHTAASVTEGFNLVDAGAKLGLENQDSPWAKMLLADKFYGQDLGLGGITQDHDAAIKGLKELNPLRGQTTGNRWIRETLASLRPAA